MEGCLSRTLLIDGDTLIFAASAATEYETQWSDWLWTLHGEFQAALRHLTDALAEIEDQLKPDHIIMAITDEENWRKSVMPGYKLHRKKTRKPITYKPLRDYCHETMDVYQRPMLEGDDILGILATHPTLIPGEKIIVSIDKDMKTIPGKHLNYQHARDAGDAWESKVHEVTVEQADRHHLFQTLTGDSSDGYPGCPGIGPVSAKKVLGAAPLWENVVAAYKKAGLGEGVALQNARVARILRHADYDFKKREVKLWVPFGQSL